jgi:hypothetical protein
MSSAININILLALDNKEMTSITFADVSKAFDRVWIRGLILKLERYGVKGELLCWLKAKYYDIIQLVDEL